MILSKPQNIVIWRLQIIIEVKENLVDNCRLSGSTERHIAKCDDWHNVLTPTKEKKINCH